MYTGGSTVPGKLSKRKRCDPAPPSPQLAHPLAAVCIFLANYPAVSRLINSEPVAAGTRPVSAVSQLLSATQRRTLGEALSRATLQVLLFVLQAVSGTGPRGSSTTVELAQVVSDSEEVEALAQLVCISALRPQVLHVEKRFYREEHTGRVLALTCIVCSPNNSCWECPTGFCIIAISTPNTRTDNLIQNETDFRLPMMQVLGAKEHADKAAPRLRRAAARLMKVVIGSKSDFKPKQGTGHHKFRDAVRNVLAADEAFDLGRVNPGALSLAGVSGV